LEPRGEEEVVGRVAEEVPVEKKAVGKVGVQREELALAAVAVVLLAVVRGGGVRGGMGVVGRLPGPQGEGGRGVGAVHADARETRRIPPAVRCSGDRRRRREWRSCRFRDWIAGDVASWAGARPDFTGPRCFGSDSAAERLCAVRL
jgi:hypothetical protein